MFGAYSKMTRAHKRHTFLLISTNKNIK